jgi:hypothetical protein
VRRLIAIWTPGRLETYSGLKKPKNLLKST